MLLATPLRGVADLVADVHTAVEAAFGPCVVGDGDGFPAEAASALEEEGVAVLQLLLKSLSLSYSPELGLAPLLAPLLLLVAHGAGSAALEAGGGSVTREALRGQRSDTSSAARAPIHWQWRMNRSHSVR